jgi:hypothetical protein
MSVLPRVADPVRGLAYACTVRTRGHASPFAARAIVKRQ